MLLTKLAQNLRLQGSSFVNRISISRIYSIQSRIRNPQFRPDRDIVRIRNNIFVIFIDINPEKLMSIKLFGKRSQPIAGLNRYQSQYFGLGSFLGLTNFHLR